MDDCVPVTARHVPHISKSLCVSIRLLKNYKTSFLSWSQFVIWMIVHKITGVCLSHKAAKLFPYWVDVPYYRIKMQLAKTEVTTPQRKSRSHRVHTFHRFTRTGGRVHKVHRLTLGPADAFTNVTVLHEPRQRIHKVHTFAQERHYDCEPNSVWMCVICGLLPRSTSLRGFSLSGRCDTHHRGRGASTCRRLGPHLRRSVLFSKPNYEHQILSLHP